MKDLVTLCTKNVPFTFNNDIYQQRDDVAMGSPIGSVIAGIIMVELENSIVPNSNSPLHFLEKVQTHAFISTGSHLHPTHGNEER